MNEFEWRHQLRDLRQPLTPQRDLWTAINAALDEAAPPRVRADSRPSDRPPRPPRRRLRWLVASGLAASMVLAGAVSWRVVQLPVARTVTSSSTPYWKPADPRLAGAAIELDSARMELQQAIEQAPDSAALQRLLSRTEHQQTQLHQLAHEAG